jgi:glycosyltransferase involved in cell wall biosynthesis
MPKVSVIIPNFNHAPYLKRRIDSVLQQTYPDFEVILLDDCSTDDSRDVLLSYKDYSKVSYVIINEKNSGSPFEQWNKGFELAKGDFIWIAESDDWCEATLLENLVKPLLEDTALVLSFCQSLLVNEKGEIIYKTQSDELEKTLTGRDFVASSMFGDTVLVNAGMAVFRKSSLAKIDNQYKSMRSAGDWLFWVNIALTGNVFISGKYLNYFMRHSGTVSSKAIICGQDIAEGNEVFLSVQKQISPSLAEIKKALTERLDIYFQQEKEYKDKQTQLDALTKIVTLHPMAKELYRKRHRKNAKKKIVKFIKKMI